MSERKDRREFMMKAGLGAGVAGLSLQAAASSGRWCRTSPMTPRPR
jgi:hypothetical protein